MPWRSARRASRPRRRTLQRPKHASRPTSPRSAQPPRPDAAKLASAAARLERQADLLRAKEAVQKGECALADAKDAKVKTDAQAKLSEAPQAAAAARKAMSMDSPNYTLYAIYPATSTGRRLALARWITSPDNPLTARVAINQIWMHHTGSPLVPTVFDFGRNGTPPAIPGLLDWLAVRSRIRLRMKPLHRLIVTSALYRMRSTRSGPMTRNLPATRPTLTTGE